MSSNADHAKTVPSIDTHLTSNIKKIRDTLGNSKDLIIKEMHCIDGWKSGLAYIDGLVDTQLLHNSVLESLMSHPTLDVNLNLEDPNNRLLYISNEILTAGDTGTIHDWSLLISNLLSGDTILLLDGASQALRIGTAGGEERAIAEPTSQSVVRGPMEGFTERLRTNTSLIRRRIKDPQLRMESQQIGTLTQTEVAIMYIKDIANDKLVEEVRQRLNSIHIDSILEGGYIEEFIQDTTITPFPTVYNSERPDTVAGALLEGRIAIIIDGTPFVLLVPALFIHFFQSAEDYYQRADISTLIRLLRFGALFITMFVPALYIAITTFHQEMIPTNLLVSLAAQREGVPFPAFIEALLMEITYEVLREAGVRIPRTVGQAISIVGTLVIGQAAVEAGIVSAVMVIVVSITAISSFVIPSISMSISVRIIRFGLMGLAAAFGLVGVLLGTIIIMLHLSSLRSFGIAYLSPLGPSNPQDWKDTILRVPWPRMNNRPVENKPKQTSRTSPHNSEGGTS